MNYHKWNESGDPKPMLGYLLGAGSARIQDVVAFPNCRTTDRKLRLFACACYYRIREILPDPRAQQAVSVTERFADGAASRQEMKDAWDLICEPFNALEERWRASEGDECLALMPTKGALALAFQIVRPLAQQAAYYASSNAYLTYADIVSAGAARSSPQYWESRLDEEQVQAEILRCIFGNPFADQEAIPLESIDFRVKNLAQQIYTNRDFADLPRLADALEDAGCTSDSVLRHCRSQHIHFRGCWVIDLILGRK